MIIYAFNVFFFLYLLLADEIVMFGLQSFIYIVIEYFAKH